MEGFVCIFTFQALKTGTKDFLSIDDVNLCYKVVFLIALSTDMFEPIVSRTSYNILQRY